MIDTHDERAREYARHSAFPAERYADAVSDLHITIRKHVKDAEARFDRALALVYERPEAVRGAFEQSLKQVGAEKVAQLLRDHPDRLGSLIRTEETIAGRESPSAAIAARHLAERAVEMIEARNVTEAAFAASQARQHIERATERERHIRREIEQMPGGNLLDYAITRGLRRLEPREITELRRVLTNPQRAIAFKIGEKIRDAGLGREQIELGD